MIKISKFLCFRNAGILRCSNKGHHLTAFQKDQQIKETASIKNLARIIFSKDEHLLNNNISQYRHVLHNTTVLKNNSINNFHIENHLDFLKNEIIDFERIPITIQAPDTDRDTNIQAARLIVIRRRKMKKHKLKKLRKKMKFEWAKVRQKREMRKEKSFQAKLLLQIKEAEFFSAEQYVKNKLGQANETPSPRFWKGKRLPQFIIKEKLHQEKAKAKLIKIE